MATAPVTNSSSSVYDALNGSTTTKTDDGSERFLKLLVTQMKNQDPMNPMDNAQVTSQIAQINTVTGI
ncbi:MAG: flagellar hook capping FlgD N-terminal domain-containing protein, partial [Methylibium sp.]|nr:flagellar hook capping FlgD N-terminal domain-containing protein [Methylibium sp.]